jgi:uncharacterized protein (TIGR02757 family)
MKIASLKVYLENQYRVYHRHKYLRTDPLVCLSMFGQAQDIEIAALVAAVLAYGRVEMIIQKVTDIFRRTGPSIAAFAVKASLADKLRLLGDFKYRFTDGYDIAVFLHSLGKIRSETDSLESLFVAGFSEDNSTIKSGLEHFTQTIRQVAHRMAPLRDKSIGYLLPFPSSGSACKRSNMYLRWMVRKRDGIDLGIWKTIPSSSLVMPVDTHVARISRELGLTRRSSADWRMAEEITVSLLACDAADPIRYDFSLCRAGMMHFRRDAA